MWSRSCICVPPLYVVALKVNKHMYTSVIDQRSYAFKVFVPYARKCTSAFGTDPTYSWTLKCARNRREREIGLFWTSLHFEIKMRLHHHQHLIV